MVRTWCCIEEILLMKDDSVGTFGNILTRGTRQVVSF